MTRSPLIGITLRVLHEKGLPADLARNRAYFDALEGAGGTPLGISSSLAEPRLRELFDLCDGALPPGRSRCRADPVWRGDACRLRGRGRRRSRSCGDAAGAVGRSMPTSRCSPSVAARRSSTSRSAGPSGRTSAPRARRSTTTRRTGRARSSRTTSTWFPTRGCTPSPPRIRSMSTACITRRCAISAATWWSPRVPHDGLVEAVEHPGRRFVVGVQCHPEELYLDRDWARRLFVDFVAAARA